jgi:hypothetical protein
MVDVASVVMVLNGSKRTSVRYTNRDMVDGLFVCTVDWRCAGLPVWKGRAVDVTPGGMLSALVTALARV